MLSEVCYGILLHAFRRQSCRTRLNTDLRSDLSCSCTLVHKWFLDLPLDNGSRLRPSTEDVSVCPASMHPSALRRTREKNYWPRRSRYSSVANLMGIRWCDSCACVNLILRRTENLGEWSISLVREKTKLSFISQLVVTRPPRGGTPGNSWWGCAARFSKSWPYFRPKHVIFHTCFQTRPLTSIPVFRPGLQAEIMLSLLRLERQQKNALNPFRIGTFLFLSYSFGIELINMFIHSRSSLENHTRFQTKMTNVYTYTRFQTKTAQKPNPMGQHIPI